MREQQSFQESKLRNCVIWASNSLSSFLSPDADPNMSLKDHGNVICPVSDWETDPFLVVFCKFHDWGFLFGGNSAADDRIGVEAESKNLVSKNGVFKDPFKGWAVNDDRKLGSFVLLEKVFMDSFNWGFCIDLKIRFDLF